MAGGAMHSLNTAGALAAYISLGLFLYGGSTSYLSLFALNDSNFGEQSSYRAGLWRKGHDAEFNSEPHTFCGDAYEHTEMCSAVKAARACVSCRYAARVGCPDLSLSTSPTRTHFPQKPVRIPPCTSSIRIPTRSFTDIVNLLDLPYGPLNASVGIPSGMRTMAMVVIAIVAASVAGLGIFFTEHFRVGTGVISKTVAVVPSAFAFFFGTVGFAVWLGSVQPQLEEELKATYDGVEVTMGYSLIFLILAPVLSLAAAVMALLIPAASNKVGSA